MSDEYSDFWDEMRMAFAASSSLDAHLQGRELDGEYFTQVRELADSSKKKNALKLPVEAGTRVRFQANLGSVLTYDDIPPSGVDGTVITVKSADGNVTAFEDRVFVLWDDGKFRQILAQHLRPVRDNSKRASSVRMVVADLGNLTNFFSASKAGDELVHKATRDLWSFRKDGDQFIIERLFDSNGKPIKV